jgi:hypothetical protein
VGKIFRCDFFLDVCKLWFCYFPVD